MAPTAAIRRSWSTPTAATSARASRARMARPRGTDHHGGGMRNSTGRAGRGLGLAFVALAGLAACAPEASRTAGADTAMPAREPASAARDERSAWPPRPQYTQALRERAQALAARD